ncbi:MAG: TetR/AcrR family transcriptional regulator [Collinsella sp.]
MDARKAKSRAAIVAAFSELLREEDYGKITVGDIIARAHVGRATFYGLFKSKDDLLVRARERYLHPRPRR